MAVGKFYDDFHDLPTKQNQFNLYKNDDEDDPTVWTNDSMPKVDAKQSVHSIGYCNWIFKIDLIFHCEMHVFCFRQSQTLVSQTRQISCSEKVENFWLNLLLKSCPNYLSAILKKSSGLAMRYHDLNILCPRVNVKIIPIKN